MRAFFSGQMIDVHLDLDEPTVRHTICIVGEFNREPEGLAVAYKSLIKPFHWPSNPIQSVSIEDARWLVDSGYWEIVKAKPPVPKYMIHAAWQEVLFDRGVKKALNRQELVDQLLDP